MKNKTIPMLLVLGLVVCQSVLARCNNAVTESTPSSRFTLNGETVTDSQTGLIWMRCSLGQSWNGTSCDGTASKMNWKAALESATSTNFADEVDWRLPNIKELTSIVERACWRPAVNSSVFPANPESWFLSSSPYATSDGAAWVVDFGLGISRGANKDVNGYVRLVRAGQ